MTEPERCSTCTDQALAKINGEIVYMLTGWRVWCSDAGTVYATRGPLSRAEVQAELVQTVSAANARELLDQIRAEVDKAARVVPGSSCTR